MTLLAGNSGPSDEAVLAAQRATVGVEHLGRPEAALNGAHDPALGLDRSVCLRDVVAWLREFDGPEVAKAFEREFGGEG